MVTRTPFGDGAAKVRENAEVDTSSRSFGEPFYIIADDEMQKRLETLGITWVAPPSGTIVDLEQMDIDTKMKFLRENKQWKCMVKWEALEEHESTWQSNGLRDLKYDIKGINKLDQDDGAGSKATLLNVDVKLNGNHWANQKCGVDYLPPPAK